MDNRASSSNAEMQSNPFAALLANSCNEPMEVPKLSTQTDSHIDESGIDLPGQVIESEKESQDVTQMTFPSELSNSKLNQHKNDLAERIFLLTDNQHLNTSEEVKRDLPSFCVLLDNDESGPLHETVEQLIFNRLLLIDPEKSLVKRSEEHNETTEKEAKEDRPLVYLLQSFNRLMHEEKYIPPNLLSTISFYRQLIVRNISTAFISPELFMEIGKEKGMVHQQFYNMLVSNDCSDPTSPPRLCLYSVADYFSMNEPDLMEAAFAPLLEVLANDLGLDDLLDAGLHVHLAVLSTFAEHPGLAVVTLNHDAKIDGKLVMEGTQKKSFLDILFGKSCLVPDPQTKAYLFFEDVARMGPTEVENEEYHLQNKTDGFHSQLFSIIRQFLKHKSTRSKTLQWFGNTIAHHGYLAKMWSHEHVDVFMDVFGPDATQLNISSVLLRLCLPFCSEKTVVKGIEEGSSKSTPPKFLKINSSYIDVTGQPDAHAKGVHGVQLHKDTRLQSTEDNTPAPVTIADSYNFITECFFLTHRSIYLSVHGLIKKFYKLNRSLNRDEDVYRQIRASGQDPNGHAALVVKRFETGMRNYLSIKGVLTEPAFLKACIRLHGTTAQYLNHIAMSDNNDTLARVVLPLPEGETVPKGLYCIPEYVVENLTDMLLFIWRFDRSSAHLFNPFIHDILLVITIYMGNKSRMSNPHLRASLAEVLPIVMPLSEDDNSKSNKEEIFNAFPHSPFLTVATLQLFVDIEFTGDPNQFEQKFHYRQPLYQILKYLWQKKSCNDMIKKHVRLAISNIDEVSHPLFLQFTNLLLNDSIYLLDEAMGFLTQIKGLEREKAAGEWEELNQQEKMQKEGELRQLGMLAKYHNLLSNDTLDTLVYLTEAKEVKELFSHPSLADRVAAMLDDFLLKLVGPKMGALRVRDLSKYQFKPKVLVVDLCQIYVHLCVKDDFCHAISKDGRSYSNKLFPMACQVLRRIGNEELRQKMMEISERVKLFSSQEEEEEEMFMDAPDEFFDALMSTLMRDPVTLPTSKQVVDRSTISRHLMSDPTDPFNRSSLTMQDVIPNTELKNKITLWIEEKRKKKLDESDS
ncbi:ubiquitin conjugation factor E4 A-like [Styela clava]